MTSEFANSDSAPEPRDYTRMMWAGILVLFIAMAIFLYFFSAKDPDVSLCRVRHIVIMYNQADPADRARALARIREIRERIVNGEDFGKLARDFSNDSMSATKGGDIGYVRKKDLDDIIDKYIWTAPIGQLSDIIQSKWGFHVVVVDDRKLSPVDALKEQNKANQDAPQNGAESAPSESPEQR